jgi:hypothetical protein
MSLVPGQADKVGDPEDLPTVFLADKFRVSRVPPAKLRGYTLRD